MARVLSDPERMNKKLISLFQGILPVKSETVPSQRDCGSAVECALPSQQWDVFRAYLTAISTSDRYSSSSNVNNAHTARCARTDRHSRISPRSLFVWTTEPAPIVTCYSRCVCYLSKQVGSA